jgi:hypothetical protein
MIVAMEHYFAIPGLIASQALDWAVSMPFPNIPGPVATLFTTNTMATGSSIAARPTY